MPKKGDRYVLTSGRMVIVRQVSPGSEGRPVLCAYLDPYSLKPTRGSSVEFSSAWLEKQTKMPLERA